MKYRTILLIAILSFPFTLHAQEEDFGAFLKQFTSSASFQMERIQFPLKSSIVLYNEVEDRDEQIPFTKELWPLVGEEIFKVGRTPLDEGGVYLSHFKVDTKNKKVFEAGLEESELDLKIEFNRINGKWYVVDCYTAWYDFSLPFEEFPAVKQQVEEENKSFREDHP